MNSYGDVHTLSYTMFKKSKGATDKKRAHLHCQTRTRVQTRIRIPSLMGTLYNAEHVHISQTQSQIPIPYFV